MASAELERKIDLDAECEGLAIKQLLTLRPHNKQLHKTYVVDGEQFITGNKHKHLLNGSGG